MDAQDLGLELIRFLVKDHRDMLAQRYGLVYGLPFCPDDESKTMAKGSISTAGSEKKEEYTENDVVLAVMEEIAQKRKFILPGRRVDYERTARTVLDEFRSGKIGRITLELP